MDDALREAKLAKLVELESYNSADELMEAVFSDAVSPAIWTVARRSMRSRPHPNLIGITVTAPSASTA
jgi:hypothetical protein